MQPTRRALLLGAAAATLGGCATAGDKQEPSTKDFAESPLEVVIFKGGYGDEYAQEAGRIYREKYPKATIDHKGIQRVGTPSGDGIHLWRARWWTQGSEPGWTAQWEDLGRC